MSVATAKKPSVSQRKYVPIYQSNPLADYDPVIRERVGQMENYIMKHCLWQFNSRGWDRRKQNAGILGKTTQLLCGETVDTSTPQEKCYWVDAVCLDRAYRASFPWVSTLSKDEIKETMKALHARLDWLTIDGSLNLELTVQNY